MERNGTTYPVLFLGNLINADANTGPQLVSPGYTGGVQLQLQGLKAMGVKAVLVEVPFPMLYQPFFSSQAQYQQFVNFYTQIATSVRALGLKLIIDNEAMLSNSALAGWNVGPFYGSLTWDQYQQARAQTARVIAQTMKPDYMVVFEEPDTEATVSGQTQANTISGATSMLNLLLSSVRQAGVSGLKVGAGVGTWHPQYLQFTQSFVTMPLDFIDMHIFPVNQSFLPNALTIASTATAAGKPVSITQAWLWKVRDTELNVLSWDEIMARNPFSFWAPLDAYFLSTLEKLANYTKMLFVNPFDSELFPAYLPYDSVQSLPAGQILSQETQQSAANMRQAIYTSTGISYYRSLVSPRDTTAPSTPTNVTGVSGEPTSTYISWNGATDNIGVAGYFVVRNGVMIGTTAQTFYQDSGLTESTTYSYEVGAFDLAGNTSYKVSVSVMTKDVIPPTAPTNVAATAVSTQQINLTWSASTDNVALVAYRVFRGNSGTNLSRVGTTYGTSTSYIDYPINSGTTYYYGVEAVDSSGNISPMSAIDSATTKP